MLTRFSHQTTCIEEELGISGRQLLQADAGLHIQNWDTHRVAKQIDSEVCVIGP